MEQITSNLDKDAVVKILDKYPEMVNDRIGLVSETRSHCHKVDFIKRNIQETRSGYRIPITRGENNNSQTNETIVASQLGSR